MMKKLILAATLLLTLAGMSAARATDEAIPQASAASAAEDTPKATAGASLGAIPEGATMRHDEGSLAFFIKAKARVPEDLAIYRPSPSMPQASEEFLRDQVTGVATTPFLGYLPKLKIIPCPDDCDSDDFQRAVQQFLQGYSSYTAKAKIEFRGEMPLQVRWFHPKRMFVPMDTNSFGISFVFEGKLVSLGKTSGSKSMTSIGNLAYDMGERMAYEMLFRAGAGLRPQFLTALDSENIIGQVGIAAGAVNVAIKSLIGGVDARSRIEPVDPVAHKHLLPGIDGIAPGEVRPIAKMQFLPSL